MKSINSIKLKFQHSSKANALVAFVSYDEQSKRYYGVQETAQCGKKVCVLSFPLKDSVRAGVLYDCSLNPMQSGKGYVIVRATPQQYKATIETCYIKNNTYSIQIKFGYKVLKFDPFSSGKQSVYDLQQFKRVLLERTDIKDLQKVCKDFESSAHILLRLIEQDRWNVLHLKNRAVKRF